MSKHIGWVAVVVLIAAVSLVAPTASHAAIFGQVSTAYTLDKGAMDLGGFVSVFEGSALVFGQYRRGLFSKADFGVQGGFIDPEVGDIGLALGADMKFLIMQTSASTPFDLALDPRFTYLNFDQFSVWSLGGSVVISRDYAVEQGSLAPYGALNLRIENSSVDDVPATEAQGSDSESDFEMSGIAGVRWDVSELLDILGEVVFDRDIGFTIGLNFKL